MLICAFRTPSPTVFITGRQPHILALKPLLRVSCRTDGPGMRKKIAWRAFVLSLIALAQLATEVRAPVGSGTPL